MGRAHGQSTSPLLKRRAPEGAEQRQRQLQTDFPQIEWDLGEVAPAAVAAVDRQFRLLAGLYPLALDQLSYIGTVNGDPEQPYGSGCWAQSFSDRLELNPHYFSDLPLLHQELAEAEQQRWHPEGCNSVESVLSHEFAHVLYRRLKEEKQTALTDAVRLGGFGTVAGTLDTWLRSRSPERVSKYARSSGEEAFAEAFASLHHTPSHRQCRYVRDLAVLLDTLLDRRRWQPARGLGVSSGAAREQAEQRLDELAAALGIGAAA